MGEEEQSGVVPPADRGRKEEGGGASPVSTVGRTNGGFQCASAPLRAPVRPTHASNNSATQLHECGKDFTHPSFRRPLSGHGRTERHF